MKKILVIEIIIIIILFIGYSLGRYSMKKEYANVQAILEMKIDYKLDTPKSVEEMNVVIIKLFDNLNKQDKIIMTLLDHIDGRDKIIDRLFRLIGIRPTTIKPIDPNQIIPK